jgi:hypothetical protein
MKRCAIISCYIVNEYRKTLVQNLIDTFKKYDIDVILASSDHIPAMKNVKNYITCKNVREESILSPNLRSFFMNHLGTFYKSSASNIYSNYFFRMYQMTSQYARSIGYDYMYFIDQDMILRQDFADTILQKEIDICKVNVYQLSETVEDYQVTFFHGNINVLCDIFGEDNIKKLAALAKTRYISNVETCFCIVAKNHPQLIVHIKNAHDIFEKANTISSSNVADVYFDKTNNKYIFLHAKGDCGPDSIFSAELLLDDKIIYSDTFSFPGIWRALELQPNTNYVIKYYDAYISPDTLYKTTKIYTDMANPTTAHYIEKNPPA